MGLNTHIAIDGRKIGCGYPPYVIAELSGNHNQSIDRAFALIRAAREAGADAVKIQTYTADTLTIRSRKDDFLVKNGPWSGRTLHDLYQEAFTPWDWHERLFACARDVGITLFSSPFDGSAIQLLEGLGAPAHKIASFELIDTNLIRLAASTGKPLILSTGLATEDEIDGAVQAVLEASGRECALLHCVSSYPAPIEEMNLACIQGLLKKHGCPCGLSDHSLGETAAVSAVALGGSIIEKHFTLSRADGGVDSAFSLEPSELKSLVQACLSAWKAVGSPVFGPRPSELESLVFRRSLYVVRDVAKGERISRENARSIRPGYGLAPKHLDRVVGMRAKVDIEAGTALTWDLLETAS